MYDVDATARDAFERDGFVVLESAIDRDTLAMLREECDGFVERTDRWLEARGKDTHSITHRGRRYFIANRHRESARMPGFLFGDLMRTLSTAFLGPTVYLFHEQWVVKGAERGMRFAWHQDSGYVRFQDPDNRHAPYLTCWCALDDMTRENGTSSVLSQARTGSRNTVFPHRREAGTNDLVGYDGDEPGQLIEAPAGSIAVFWSTTLHKSGANATDRPRRAYLPQYSREPIRRADGSVWSLAIPFVRDGELVYEPSGEATAATLG
ncbi:MAG: phytanoyl-CoA dioxygenase family protein [Gammaproteobacteria bacterium]|nr:phytanoyl-CoA dioxygenase family protein [Gammaproteobacteria bacterium]